MNKNNPTTQIERLIEYGVKRIKIDWTKVHPAYYWGIDHRLTMAGYFLESTQDGMRIYVKKEENV